MMSVRDKLVVGLLLAGAVWVIGPENLVWLFYVGLVAAIIWQIARAAK